MGIPKLTWRQQHAGVSLGSVRGTIEALSEIAKKAADSNGDGKIQLGELRGAMRAVPPRMRDLMERVHAGVGFLDNEANAGAPTKQALVDSINEIGDLFVSLDSNVDGALDVKELRGVNSSMRQAIIETAVTQPATWTALSSQQLEEAAVDFVHANTELVPGVSSGKPLPNLDEGRSGLAAAVLAPDMGVQAVALFRTLKVKGSEHVLKSFDPKKHCVILAVGSDADPSIYLSVLNRYTGKAASAGSHRVVAIPGGNGLPRPDGDPVNHLLTNATPLPLRRAADDPEFQRVNSKVAEVRASLAGAQETTSAVARAGLVPTSNRSFETASLLYRGARQADGVRWDPYISYGQLSRLLASDDPSIIAKALVAAHPGGQNNAGLPEIEAKVQAAIVELGEGPLGVYEQRDPAFREGAPSTTVRAKCWTFVNDRGVYVSFYARPPFE